ncbi:exodeoxyribonuclease VII small subunit [bacterium]|nr:exodeoxyribonuclease VII small subunit [bacterium]
MAKKTNETFEKQLARLNEIVQKLDDDDTALEESMKLYEEGIVIVEKCVTYLSEARQKIKELRKRSDGVFELLDVDEE